MSSDDLDERLEAALAALPRLAAPAGVANAARARFIAARVRLAREQHRLKTACLLGIIVLGGLLGAVIDWSALPATLGRTLVAMSVLPTVLDALHELTPRLFSAWLVAQVAALILAVGMLGALARTARPSPLFVK